jgi:hypothetical protein
MTMTTESLRQAGLAALQRELGAAGMARFIQQFELGRGDYTAERWAWLPKDSEVGPLAAKIRQALPKKRSGKKRSA